MRYKIYLLLLSWSFMLIPPGIQAQSNSLTLEECYALAREHYPLTRQFDLIRKSETFTVDNLAKGFLPQAGVYAQATYQSDVTRVPITLPGMEIPVISKDQYRLYGEVTQTLYEGGIIRQQQTIQEAQTRTEEQKLEVELYRLNERVHQLFFSILLLDEQLRQLDHVKQDIDLGLNKIRAAIAYGTAFKSNETVLQAELLKLRQREIEIISARKAFVAMLAHMTGLSPDEEVTLIRPEAVIPSTEIRRPELTLFDRQAQSLAAQEKLLMIKNRPKLNFFIQGGIGRPALNMLDNDLKGFYLGGLRAAWPLTGYYTNKNERQLLELQRQGIDIQRETFLFNTRLQLRQQGEDIRKWEDLIATDDEIITLRTEIKQTALAQMENGVITSNDYLQEVNAEDQARQNKMVHVIQWLMSQYSLQHTTGNTN